MSKLSNDTLREGIAGERACKAFGQVALQCTAGSVRLHFRAFAQRVEHY